jgi:hypothetical protein
MGQETLVYSRKGWSTMSKFLRSVGSFIAIVGGLVGFVLSLLVIYSELGGVAVVVALFIFPATFGLVPFYTLLAYGSWTLLFINYGSMVAGWALHILAERIEENQGTPRAKSVPKPAIARAAGGNPVGIVVTLLLIGGLFAAVVLSTASPYSSIPAATSTRRPTLTATKTPLPRLTRTSRPVSIDACVTDSTINIRKGPGTHYESIGGMVSGTCMAILGRNQDSSWVYMVTEDNKAGWVAASLLTIEGNLSRVSVRSDTGTLSLAPPTRMLPTATTKPTRVITNTPMPLLSRSELACSQTASRIGEYVTCKIERADCNYLPATDGSPTFCNDVPYPNHNFTLLVFGEDWSDYDGSCILVSGVVERYRGLPQIQAVSRSQVSYCE